MDDEVAFLRAIANAPADNAPRLIYSDWLEERGDPRAEYVRLEVELSSQPSGASDRKLALRDRARQLANQLDAKWVDRFWLMRAQTVQSRLDLVVVDGANSLIDVRGGDGETGLYVAGQPIALNWDDCQGSVGQYLVVAAHPGNVQVVEQMANFVAGNVDEHRPLGEQIAPLVATLAAGTYWLQYTPSAVIGSYEVHNGALRTLQEYYPLNDRQLVCTQPHDALHEGRVSFHRGQIAAGRRPVVLTVAPEGSWCEFVIDGHHKLEAYARASVKPTILNIVRWSAPGLSLEEGVAIVPAGNRGHGHYRRMKLQATR